MSPLNPDPSRPTCHNFGPPALQSKRCVARMLRQIFRSQNFRDATLEEEGSEGKPYKEKGSNDTPRTKPTALPVACVKLAKAKLSPKKPHVFRCKFYVRKSGKVKNINRYRCIHTNKRDIEIYRYKPELLGGGKSENLLVQ